MTYYSKFLINAATPRTLFSKDTPIHLRYRMFSKLRKFPREEKY